MTKKLINLVIHPDSRLRMKSAEVKDIDNSVREMLDDMVDAMNFFNGIGLAGVQIGYMHKLAVVDYDAIVEHMKNKGLDVSKYPLMGKPMRLINAKVLSKSGDLIDSNEGCLSLPGINGDIKRSSKVKISYIDYDGKEQEFESDLPLLSACIQHEIDHTDGILFYDHMSGLKKKMIVKKLEKYIASHDINTVLDPNVQCGSGCSHEHH